MLIFVSLETKESILIIVCFAEDKGISVNYCSLHTEIE
jgi:hypothetical protein